MLIILDAGTGIFPLGLWVEEQGIKKATLLLSHTHFDHIMGLPFFKPFWDPRFTLSIYAGLFFHSGGLQSFFEKHMNHPFFPGSMIDMTKAQVNLHDIEPETSFTIPHEIQIRTLSLNHPGGATGYRLEFEGKSLCYISDLEHKIGEHDEKILSFINKTDCLIYDAMYTEEELKSKIGWGHSTWEEAAHLANSAGVKKLFIYHHNSEHTDETMSIIEDKLQRACGVGHAARQGMSFFI